MRNPDEVAKYVKANWAYDPKTGVVTGTRGRPIGVESRGWLNGSVKTPAGTVVIGLHRVAFLMMLGRWPTDQTDHINGVRRDNRWSNLREATGPENAQNRRPRKRESGLPTGVYFDRKAKKYTAQRRFKGVLRYGGSFATVEEAHRRSVEMKTELHTFQPHQRLA